MRVILATQGDFFKWFTSSEADAYFNTIKPTDNPADPNFGPYQVKISRELMKAFFGSDLSKTGLASLDSLLGMEGNDVRKMEWVKGTADLGVAVNGYLPQLSSSNPLLEIVPYQDPLPFTLEQFVFPISP
jgi:hypothetical protein